MATIVNECFKRAAETSLGIAKSDDTISATGTDFGVIANLKQWLNAFFI